MRVSVFSGRRLPPSLLPIDLRTPGEASRVQHVGLKRNAVGGGFLLAPSALCGSPTLTWCRTGSSMLPCAIARRAIASAHTSTREQWFLAPLADISSKICQGLHSPKGYARFLRITMALLSQAPQSWELASPSWRLLGHVSHRVGWPTPLMSKGS